MSWNNWWRTWAGGGPSGDAGAEGEIDEELMFHLRALVEENVARGMAPDVAWQEAQRRFGSLRRHAEACRGPAIGIRMAQAFAIAALVVAGVILGEMLIEARSREKQEKLSGVLAQMQDEQQKLAAAVAEVGPRVARTEARLQNQESKIAKAERAPRRPVAANHTTVPAAALANVRHDLTGRVLDSCGQPLADVTLLVILKTWPNGRYRQQPFTLKSDAEGKFCLPRLIPSEGQVAVQVAALRPGYALTSNYQLLTAPRAEGLEPITLELAAAAPLTLVVHDRDGRPVAGARVAPASRESADGGRQIVYFQGSESVHSTADAAGRVGLDYFVPGDAAQIFLQLPGHEWEEHAISIPADSQTISVSADVAAEDNPEST